MNKTSVFPGFHDLTASERIEKIKGFCGLTDEDVDLLYEEFVPRDVFERFVKKKENPYKQWKEDATKRLEEYAIRWGENTIGKFAPDMPLRIAPNFLIDNVYRVVPMAVEESSIVAAASKIAGLALESGGFETSYTGSLMIGQIQSINVTDPRGTIEKIHESKSKLLEIANSQDKTLVSFGGGAKDLEVRHFKTPREDMVVTHLIVDVKDAMGANAVNTMVEAVAPEIEKITGYKTNLKIVSNLADKRLAGAKCRIPIKKLERENFSGEEVAERILSAFEEAYYDEYRAATHNKGIMNGIDAVLIPQGQDWRAVEAGAHSYAARSGHYSSLTTCKREGDYLYVEIKLPMAVGVVGGAKDSRIDLYRKILGVKSAEELARTAAAVGLAQNIGAVRALTTEGIQRGHMYLHAKRIVEQIGAGKYASRVLEELEKGPVTYDRAVEILKHLKEN
jgi:hydroxymethylglutaryl-CoA reductase